MKELCVVHLVHAQNGTEPLRYFLESYRQNPGGIDHDLLVVFKGFISAGAKAEHLKSLTSFRYVTLDVPDIGYDITAYFAVAGRYASEYRYFCFLNSFSVIQGREWLTKLYNHISRPGIGLAGATGSWQSHRGFRNVWLAPMDGFIQYYNLYKDKPIWKRLIFGVAAGCQYGHFLWDINPFPNCHLRTNAFIISSELMKRVKCPDMKSKLDAYRFESGKNGLTQQILKMGKTILIVGKDGSAYEMQQWNESRIFWQTNQENLLIADNQTRDYQYSDFERRKYLSCMAWGK